MESKKKIEKIKAQADVICTHEKAKKELSNLPLIIMEAKYKYMGYYTFTMDGKKYFVE